MATGTLYIVATPIGNLEDMTFRAVRILREVALIAAEDTRHTRKLLSHFGISRPLTSYYDHSSHDKGAMLLSRLRGGESVALVSDAGTPCISDPGYRLVHDAVAEGIKVVPIPGPSATLAALSASGLPTDSFTFVGFLPSRGARRREKLGALRDEPRLLVFYEAPHRLAATLADMAALLGDRHCVVGRELTKLHEEFIRGSLQELSAALDGRSVKGECVILVSPAMDADDAVQAVDPVMLLRHHLALGLSVKDASRLVSLETGLSRSDIYRAALQIQGDPRD
jgi:16S rRNA (cytidine1402-2'-O)-methyltransferase